MSNTVMRPSLVRGVPDLFHIPVTLTWVSTAGSNWMLHVRLNRIPAEKESLTGDPEIVICGGGTVCRDTA